MSISALIITKNEQRNIQACLESLQWVDEIVVIDSFSTDDTVEIAKKFTDKVYLNAWPGYSNQKNFGHTKCSQEWILSIDADERITPELQQEIKQAIQNRENVAYRIRIKDFMFGKWIEHTGKNSQNHIRLYRADNGVWESNVHEVVKVTGPVGSLNNKILHFSHLTIAKFIEKANRYTEIEAQNRFQQGIRKNWWVILASSFRVFLYYYISNGGFRDKGHGLLRSILLAFYHFLVRVKLWELWYKHDHGIVE